MVKMAGVVEKGAMLGRGGVSLFSYGIVVHF
jgi:hypothetical protein